MNDEMVLIDEMKYALENSRIVLRALQNAIKSGVDLDPDILLIEVTLYHAKELGL